MFCSRCGSPLTSGMQFCGMCGAPASAPAGPPVALQRPGIITILAVLQFIGGAFWLLGTLGAMAGLVGSAAEADAAIILPVAVVMGGCGVLQIVCGVGLLKLKSYGRTLQIVFAVIGLLAIPVGTVISVLLLIYLSKPGIKILFSERPASDLSAAELAEVAAVTTASTGVIVLIVVAVLVLLLFVVAIIAAIAVPGLMRARVAGNEAGAIASLRSIAGAEAAYAATCASGGYAVSLEDLARTQSGSGGFVPPELGTTGVEKYGYRLMIERDRSVDVVDVGTAAATCNGAASAPASSFFASAEPVNPGATGTRYFATDARGTIFESTRPIANPLVAGPSVTPIR